MTKRTPAHERNYPNIRIFDPENNDHLGEGRVRIVLGQGGSISEIYLNGEPVHATETGNWYTLLQDGRALAIGKGDL